MGGFMERMRHALFGQDRVPAELYEVRGFRVVVENSRPDIETSVVKVE